MSFSDLFKKSVVEGFSSQNVNIGQVCATLGFAILLGLFIYFIYRTACRSGFYNRNFNKSLASMPLITAAIMLAMQSNLVISLGMVGALSIVRFRNAVKDSVDLTYLFWSISVGIIVGAGLLELALILSILMALLLFGLDMVPSFRAPCLLIIAAENTVEEALILSNVRKFAPKAQVRSRNVSAQGMEWILELQVQDGGGLVRQLSALEGVYSVNLMNHDGDVRY